MNLLAPEVAWSVFTHPAHKENAKRVEKLIIMLRECRTPGDFHEFQGRLFHSLFAAEERRAQCNWIVRRMEQGRRLPTTDRPPHPHSGDPTTIESWDLERYVYAQIARQLRSVGDALAWRCFNYDRRMIVALSRSDPAGPLHEAKEGLGFELGRIEQLWRDNGNFALLHDLTNCLRIGDLTEFTADNGRLLYEVKKQPGAHNTKKSKQLKRMQAAIDAIMNGGVLPGGQPDARFVELTEPYVVNLKQLNDLLQLAKKHGRRGMRLPQGRALVATSLPVTLRRWGQNPEEGQRASESIRRRAIERAGIETAMHHLVGVSGDTAARSPTMAPWAIYPFSSEDCAALICNLLSFEAILSLNGLADSLTKAGLHAEMLIPPGNGELRGAKEVIRAHLNNNAITLHAEGLNVLLYELLEPDVWARGIRETLTQPDIPAGPALIFSNEHGVWFQAR